MGLLLEAVQADGPWRWRWLLRDEQTGNPLADHPVSLDPGSAEVQRFFDLYGYLRSYAVDPDRRTEDGARIVAAAGAWAGRELLGEAIGAAILDEAPVTVRVTVPAELDHVLLWPLELAHAGGRPLAAQGDVTLIYDIAPDARARPKSEVGPRLRMLAVFSQPTKTSVLALRRERYALSQLIRQIAARDRAMVELRVIQYGATRQRLAEIADSDDGWDVLHLSGHGAGGAFLLEHADGSPDVVAADELVRLLRPARRRVKLAVVSACESAADTTAQTLRLLGLTEQAEEVEAAGAADAEPAGAAEAGDAAGTGPEAGGQGGGQGPGLARALVRELDCAVVAMRYPVTDEFAMAFGDVFYQHLFSRGQPADVAAARALTEAAGAVPSAARPAVSLATPGVFGARAAGLRLPVPRGIPEMDPAGQRLAYFPPEPARFVGRAEAMARAGAALAPGSGNTAVLLHGMAGAGKTACALELAYRHAEGFAAAAFWQAPTRDEEWAGALGDLAARLDIQLRDYGFTMAGNIGTVADLEAFLPRLRQVLAASGVLLVLDNLETLLTGDGTWRDPRWGLLADALTGHGGESRVIMTSRTVPAGLGAGTVTLPVHGLSRDEAVALARELPHLRALLHADPGPVRSPAAADADRRRLRQVLLLVQGHPKLMELADAAAADPARLDARLAAAQDTAAPGGALEAFFRDGASNLDPAQFLTALNGWTTAALGELSPAARLMAGFVACLEDTDRVSALIEANWAELWQRLEQAGEAPGPGPLLATLAAAALIEADLVSVPVDEGPASAGPGGTGGGLEPTEYRVHPGVAEAITAATGRPVRDAVDAELGAFWRAVFGQALNREGGEDSGLVVQAGLAAAPYLLRRSDWETASTLLEYAAARDGSPGTVQAVLPSLRRIVAVTGEPADVEMLARALSSVDPGEAERLLRGAVQAADAAGDYRVASTAAGDLVNLLRDAGRLGEALDVIGQKDGYTRRAGFGRWTQLADQAQRLQVLDLMGEHEQVLAEVGRLRAVMAGLPARSDAEETANPWNVREGILSVGYSSASATGEWQECLKLNAEVIASKRERGAWQHEVTRSQFNDSLPLIRLGLLAEAGRLLAECQQVFEDHRDITMLQRVLSTRADLEDELGHGQAAVDLERAATRLCYARPEPRDIMVSHHNLANYLGRLGGDPAGQRAHRLAAALIARLAGMAHFSAVTVRALGSELRADDAGPALASTVAQVTAVVGQTEGVRLGELLAALQPDPTVVEDALADILAAAAAMPPDDSAPDLPRIMQAWEPVIAAIAAACQPGQQPPADLLQFLDRVGKEPDWATLVAVLRRILAGERDEASLLDGLDPVDTAIARETRSRLAQ